MPYSSSKPIVALVVAATLAAGVFVAGDAFGGRHRRVQIVQPTEPVLPGAQVTVYGDSLVSQSAPYLQAVGTALGLTVKTESFYGTAPCDFLPKLTKDLARQAPDVVVWAFSGNSIGTCMIGPDHKPLTGADIISKYRTDTLAAVKETEAAGARFVLVSPPAARSVGDWPAFDSMFRGIAAADADVDYVDGGVEIAPDGHFMSTQACLPFETQLSVARGECTGEGRIPVRTSDGVHFCPVDKQLNCPVYSSGAMRYTLAILSAVRLDVDYRFQQGKK